MARQQARRRHRERLVGITLAVLGVVVLVVAVIAIIEPKSHTTDAAGVPTTSAAKSGPTSAVPSRTRSKASSTASSSRPGPSLSLGGTSPTPTGTAGKLPLVVLNNTTTNGLATDAAQAFRNGGWTVSDIGNLQNEIISTCAYYDPSVPGAEAAAKALQTQFPGIQRVVEKFSELPSGPVVVVLTSDYSTG